MNSQSQREMNKPREQWFSRLIRSNQLGLGYQWDCVVEYNPDRVALLIGFNQATTTDNWMSFGVPVEESLGPGGVLWDLDSGQPPRMFDVASNPHFCFGPWYWRSDGGEIANLYVAEKIIEKPFVPFWPATQVEVIEKKTSAKQLLQRLSDLRMTLNTQTSRLRKQLWRP